MAETTNNPQDSAIKQDEIALEMMKFIAVQTGYGKSGGSPTGFIASTAKTPEAHAEALLELYTRCRKVVKAS